MPRVKKTETTANLERQIKELTGKLNAAKAKAKAEEREKDERLAKAIGRAILRELRENREGAVAVYARDFLPGMLKPSERALFEAAKEPAKGNGATDQREARPEGGE